MSDSLLRHPLHSGHLTVGALKRNKDKPVLSLGDTTLTGRQLADRISQYIQAFEALDAGTGTPGPAGARAVAAVATGALGVARRTARTPFAAAALSVLGHSRLPDRSTVSPKG